MDFGETRLSAPSNCVQGSEYEVYPRQSYDPE